MKLVRWELVLLTAFGAAWVLGYYEWTLPVIVGACWIVVTLWNSIFGGITLEPESKPRVVVPAPSQQRTHSFAAHAAGVARRREEPLPH